jgi:hypothetical protein
MKTGKNTRDANDNKHSTKKKRAKKQIRYEWRRIDELFEWFPVDYSSELFWEMLKLAITFDEEGPDGRERSNMIALYEYTTELYENIFTLLEKEKGKPKYKK